MSGGPYVLALLPEDKTLVTIIIFAVIGFAVWCSMED